MACRIEKNLEFESVEIEGEKIPEVIHRVPSWPLFRNFN